MMDTKGTPAVESDHKKTEERKNEGYTRGGQSKDEAGAAPEINNGSLQRRHKGSADDGEDQTR